MAITKAPATIEDLYHVVEDGKAELVDGEIVLRSPTSMAHGRARGALYISLREYERLCGGGYAVPGNVAYVVDLPHRKSFCPDGSWFVGRSNGFKFLDGAPIFAAEVRDDYSQHVERAIARKRADYFAAGTLVVWDVDLLSEDVIKVYRASDPDQATIYRHGEIAEAEPAVPGWRMPVDELFV